MILEIFEKRSDDGFLEGVDLSSLARKIGYKKFYNDDDQNEKKKKSKSRHTKSLKKPKKKTQITPKDPLKPIITPKPKPRTPLHNFLESSSPEPESSSDHFTKILTVAEKQLERERMMHKWLPPVMKGALWDIIFKIVNNQDFMTSLHQTPRKETPSKMTTIVDKSFLNQSSSFEEESESDPRKVLSKKMIQEQREFLAEKLSPARKQFNGALWKIIFKVIN